MRQEESTKSNNFYLYLEMPIFDFPLVYDEKVFSALNNLLTLIRSMKSHILSARAFLNLVS